MFSEKVLTTDEVIAQERGLCGLEEGETQLQVLTFGDEDGHWTVRVARLFGVKSGN